MQPNTVAALGRSGLKVIDFGLESASPRQLKRMRKADKPEHYLQQASDILRACHDNGIWAKVNVLLYAGEDRDTLAETTDWLETRRDWIKGVSVGPVVVYGRDSGTLDFMRELQTFGASPVEASSSLLRGYSELHLSSSLSFEEAQHASLQLSKRFMTDRDYYDLKAFTYLPRSYTFEDFHKDGIGINNALLPYTVSHEPRHYDSVRIAASPNP